MATIGILLFDDVEELDAIGPWEVLAFWCARFPDDGWAVTTFSHDGGIVRCAKGLRVVPDHSDDTVPALDMLLYPGGRGARLRVDDGGRGRVGAGPAREGPVADERVHGLAGLREGRAPHRSPRDHALGRARPAGRPGPR